MLKITLYTYGDGVRVKSLTITIHTRVVTVVYNVFFGTCALELSRCKNGARVPGPALFGVLDISILNSGAYWITGSFFSGNDK